MIEYCKKYENIPEDENKAFVLAYEHSMEFGFERRGCGRVDTILYNHKTFAEKFNARKYNSC